MIARMHGVDIEKRDFAQTLARGLACLETLAAFEGPATGSQVAAAIGASRAAARRLLLTLESLGYVHEDRGRYATAPKVLALGRGLLGTRSVWSAAAPEVVALADRFNEPCSIVVLDGLEILFVCRDATRRIYTSRLGIGDRLPAHCSASGKMLLASLPEAERRARLDGARLPPQGPASITDPGALQAALAGIRADGFALAVDEMEAGTLSIAVPLRERGGRTVAAMSVASHRSRLSAQDLEAAVLPALRAAAGRVEGVIRDFQDRGWAAL
jgi:IclR family pca regulon transcriptional regulator